MTNFVTDSFTGTNGTLLSAHTPDVGGSVTSFVGNAAKIQSNELTSDGATLSRYFYGATPGSADYSVQVIQDVKSVVGNDAVAIHARLDSVSQNTWYHLEWSQTFGGYRIVKVVGGTSTVLGTWTNTPSIAQHTLKLTVTGSSSVHLVATIDGVDRITVDDASSPITSAGKAGLTIRLAAAAGTGSWLDSFSADTVVPLPQNTVAPVITGTATIESLLSTTGGSWTDDGTGVLTFQWQRSHTGALWGDIAGATSSSYTLTDSEDGMLVQVKVTDTDAAGATMVTSASVGQVVRATNPSLRKPVVPTSNTFHFIGDMHFGATSSVRTNMVLADLKHRLVPTPLAHFQVGDQVNDALASQDMTALAWFAQITDAPVYVAVGNHDLYLDQSSSNRTVAAWQTAYAAYIIGGSKNYVVDFPTVRVIVLGPDVATGDVMPLTQATLDWWAARLAETSLDCWTIFHLPLKATVLNSDAVNYWSSDLSGIYALGPNGTDDTEIRAVLAAHANAKAWISGHSHSPISDNGMAALTKCGNRLVAAINTSSINWEGRTQEWNDPFHTVYLTRLSSGAIEVRYRDHGAGVWAAPSSSRVITLIPS